MQTKNVEKMKENYENVEKMKNKFVDSIKKTFEIFDKKEIEYLKAKDEEHEVKSYSKCADGNGLEK